MKTTPQKSGQYRQELLREINQLARRALFGTISETYRTCGNPDCRCHHKGPKHGPHLYVSYRGDKGKTTGYYVPQAIQTELREGIAAWTQLQDRLRQLAESNKERVMKRKPGKKATFATGSS
jgi:hypothetical protein